MSDYSIKVAINSFIRLARKTGKVLCTQELSSPMMRPCSSVRSITDHTIYDLWKPAIPETSCLHRQFGRIRGSPCPLRCAYIKRRAMNSGNFRYEWPVLTITGFMAGEGFRTRKCPCQIDRGTVRAVLRDTAIPHPGFCETESLRLVL